MTEEEVEGYFPGALAPAKALLTERGLSGQTRYQCDDMDLHLTVVLDEKNDRYATFSWRPVRAVWKFSF
jgi:hypothetical protein